MSYKKFEALNVSSKFAICGLPLRVDTYKNCSFGCTYCFANCRKVMEFDKHLQVANLCSVGRRLKRVLKNHNYKKESFLDNLIAQGVTWHCGGMSDPFQPIESYLKVTEDLIDICNSYDVKILFSTKSDTVYNANIRPDLHTFQLSITNTDDRKDLEPNVAPITKRLEFFKNLKGEGFKVGVRIQPFIPNVSNLEIVKMFEGADHFTLEGLKIVPQNKEHKEYLLDVLDLKKEDFTQMGLLNLKPERRLEMYKPFIKYFEEHNISYSIADNDLHDVGNNECCCGDALIHKGTTFNNTCLIKKYGLNYTKEDLDKELNDSGLAHCKANQLFTSNRQEGCITVQEFFDKRFDRKSSPFSPKFLYNNKKKCEGEN